MVREIMSTRQCVHLERIRLCMFIFTLRACVELSLIKAKQVKKSLGVGPFPHNQHYPTQCNKPFEILCQEKNKKEIYYSFFF